MNSKPTPISEVKREGFINLHRLPFDPKHNAVSVRLIARGKRTMIDSVK